MRALEAMAPDAELCPHVAARARAAVMVQGGQRAMIVCHECKAAFGEMIRAWHRREIGSREVVAAMSELGYSRLDGARFVLQLLGDRFRVRLGFMSEADL